VAGPGDGVAEEKRLPRPLPIGGGMLQALSIIGQTILILLGLGLVVVLVLFNLAGVRAIRRLVRDLREPNLPYTDAYVPPPFDR
jgi:hypothetical protein